jgi:hypothetical protein
MKFKNILAIKLLAISILATTTIFAQTGEILVNKYLEATGGKEKISNLKNFGYKKSYSSNAATDYKEEVNVVSAENKFFRKKSILERDFYYVLNGNSGWIKIPMGSRDKAPTYTTKDLNEKEKNDLLNEVTDGLLPFVDFASKGYTQVGELKNYEIDGNACEVLTIEKGTTKREYYFDKTNGLLKREIATINGITHTTDHLKYGETDNGIKYPSESSYINTKDKKKTSVNTEWILDALPQANMFKK